LIIIINIFLINQIKWGLGIGDWGLGIGDWGLGPIPNPQSPIPIYSLFFILTFKKINKFKSKFIMNNEIK